MCQLPGVLELLVKAIKEGDKDKVGRYEIVIASSETVKNDFYQDIGKADLDIKDLICTFTGIKIEIAA